MNRRRVATTDFSSTVKLPEDFKFPVTVELQEYAPTGETVWITRAVRTILKRGDSFETKLTREEVDAITNYNNLRVVFTEAKKRGYEFL